MTNDNKTYDLFISHSRNDAPLAATLAEACRASGLETMTELDLPAGVEMGDVIWQALAESRALLVVLSPSGLTPTMGIEIGAAQAWNKPIFAVLTDASMVHLPAPLTHVKAYPPGRIGDVVDLVGQIGRQLSEEDRSHLATVYGEIGVSVDQLAQEPKHLQMLVKRFNARTQKSFSGERLLTELFRLRKQGRLKKSRSSGRSEPRTRTA
jgi:hypothetical protein